MDRSTIVPLSLALMVAACSRAPSPSRYASPHSGHVITHDMIAKSGSRTAWDALRRHAPYMSFSEDRRGQPTSLSRRGRSSFVLSDAPMVLVDNVKVGDYRLLKQMPAKEIESIRILSSIDGTTYYGTNAVGGVIEIHTKVGRYDVEDEVADSTGAPAKPEKP